MIISIGIGNIKKKQKKTTEKQILDSIVAGTRALQKNLIHNKNKPSRYRWGAASGLAEVEGEEVEGPIEAPGGNH